MFSYSNLSPAGRQVQAMTVGETLWNTEMQPRTEFKVRFTIHHDTSYANQSYAEAEVWSQSDLAWHGVDTYFYSEWAHDTHRENKDGPTDGIVLAYEELKARAMVILF